MTDGILQQISDCESLVEKLEEADKEADKLILFDLNWDQRFSGLVSIARKLYNRSSIVLSIGLRDATGDTLDICTQIKQLLEKYRQQLATLRAQLKTEQTPLSDDEIRGYVSSGYKTPISLERLNLTLKLMLQKPAGGQP